MGAPQWPSVGAQQPLTWVGDAVLVARNVFIQSLEHHPHGEREHPRQKTVEDEVEEQDEAWSSGKSLGSRCCTFITRNTETRPLSSAHPGKTRPRRPSFLTCPPGVSAGQRAPRAWLGPEIQNPEPELGRQDASDHTIRPDEADCWDRI